MLNDLYCEYYPTYKGVVTADADQGYRVCTKWRASIKPDAYAKKHPRTYFSYKGYSQASFGRMKSKMRAMHLMRHVKNQPKMRIAYFRREQWKITMQRFALVTKERPQEMRAFLD